MISNSSSSNGSFPPHLLFISSNLLSYISCINTSSNPVILTAFYVIYILLILPLYIFTLYLCLQQCRQRHPTSSAGAMSHSDCVACHMTIMELVGISGYTFSCFAIFWKNSDMQLAGFLLAKFTWYGETIFHALTCVELHVAVIHPITYRKLKNQTGIRIRNVTIACVWVICVAMIGLAVKDFIIIIDLCLLVSCLMVIFFSSLSILWVLMRPPPGDQDKDRVDKSKLKAFYTILSILGVLALRFAWGLVWAVQNTLRGDDLCLIITCAFMFNLPSSLILPLLFLQRAGKLVCCKKNSQ